MAKTTNSAFKGIVDDFGAFLKYLTSIWGPLSIFSAIFPLINRYLSLIPEPPNNPDLIVALSILGNVFIVFYYFTNRKRSLGAHIKEREFINALIFVLIYILVLPNLPEFPTDLFEKWYAASPLNQFMGDILNTLWLLVNPVFYIGIFYLFTRIFAVLAVQEWQSR
jgi:hypothetical protein